MHYFQFNIGEYASHTRHLSPIEDIAYRRMLDLAYTTELPLPKDVRTLSRLLNLREHQTEVADVLSEFFYEVEDGWVNNRVLKEIEKTGRKSESARNSVAKRWEKQRNANVPKNDTNVSESNENGKLSDVDLDGDLNESYENDTNVSKNSTNEPEMDTTNNPLPITKEKKGADKSAFVLDEKIPSEVWDMWDKYRSGKKWTLLAKKLSHNKLVELVNQGHNPRVIVELSIERGWTGLFAPKDNLRYDAQSRPIQVAKSPEDEEAMKKKRKLEAEAGLDKWLKDLGAKP